MLDKDFQADGKEYDSTQQVGMYLAGVTATLHSERDAHKREQERHQPYDSQRIGQIAPMVHSHTHKRNTYGQGIDTGGDGHHEYDFETGRVEMFFVFVLERLNNHAYAQKGQYAEGYPMVDTLYEMPEIAGSQPAEKRIECLEQAEEEGHGEHGFPTESPPDDAAGYRHGKTIHGQTQGQGPNF